MNVCNLSYKNTDFKSSRILIQQTPPPFFCTGQERHELGQFSKERSLSHVRVYFVNSDIVHEALYLKEKKNTN